MKSRGKPYRPKSVTLVTIVHIPETIGYWAESLDVLKICLHSARTTTRVPHDLMVVDNGSCAEARAYLSKLHARGEIDFLVLSSRNLGKPGAWNLAFPAAPGEYIAYFDSDVAFRADWLEESIKVIDEFDHAGMVTARPRKAPRVRERDDDRVTREAIARAGPDLTVERGKLIPQDVIDEHFRSVGAEMGTRGYPEEEIRITRGGVSAYVGSSHFQFLTTRRVAREILPIEITTHPLGDDFRWDVGLGERGLLRLSLVEPLVVHLGNSLRGETLSSEQEALLSSSSRKTTPPARRWWMGSSLVRRALKKVNRVTGNLLLEEKFGD